MRTYSATITLLLALLMSCTETTVPAPDTTPGDGGKFGHWTMDSALGPVFNYTRPEGVTYTTSYGTSDLHMHLIGNQSLNAFVRPEGGADIIIRDPGLLWLTRDPIRQAHLADGAAVVLPDGQLLPQRPADHLRLCGIYADAAVLERRYDGRQPCDLLGGTDGRGIGVTAGRAQVHIVGALPQQLAGVLQRALRVEVVPPVREGVRGQIDDADDRGHRLSMPDWISGV